MTSNGTHYHGTSVLMEMAEFAAFSKSTQRYIRRSLDVGLSRRDAIKHWARSEEEAESIRTQYQMYERLDEIRALIPDKVEIGLMTQLTAILATVSVFDLAQARLPSFAAYRFLYERLFGARVRPWLPAAFYAAASLPLLHPDHRRALLESVDDAGACAGWSCREPGFIPEWVDKVDARISA